MLPEKLEFLSRFDSFYKMLTEQAKQNKLNESEFYMIIKAKAKAMERELRAKVEIKVDHGLINNKIELC